MKKFFSDSNPLIRGLTKLADLMWLNVLFIVTSIPIVTIGASVTALYYEAMRVVKGEEAYTTRDYFRAFKENFKYATLIWLLLGGLLVLFGYTFYVLGRLQLSYSHIAMGVLGVPITGILFTMLYVFPILSRFENTMGNTLINALLISLVQFPRTILMLAFSAVPVLLVLAHVAWVPVVLLMGFALVAYVNGSLMNKIFDRIRDAGEENDPA